VLETAESQGLTLAGRNTTQGMDTRTGPNTLLSARQAVVVDSEVQYGTFDFHIASQFTHIHTAIQIKDN
jgi:hypothetical protein